LADDGAEPGVGQNVDPGGGRGGFCRGGDDVLAAVGAKAPDSIEGGEVAPGDFDGDGDLGAARADGGEAGDGNLGTGAAGGLLAECAGSVGEGGRGARA